MKLADLAQKPQLTKLTIDKPELVEKYGEEIEFHVYDRQPLDVFTKFANTQEGDVGTYVDTLVEIILNDKGEPIMKDGMILPMDVMVEAMKLIGETLGK